MAHLRAYVGSSWRSCSPSCLSCSPSWRRHGQQFEAKCNLRANIIEDSPQDASATPSKHPKSAKNQRKPKVFQCFSLSSHGTKIDQKCSQNPFRSSQVESKMAIFPLAWLILKVSWPIWVATYHQLGPSFGHLRSNFAGIFNQMTPCTRRNAPKAPKILSAFNLPRFSIPLELHFQCSLFVQCHSVRSNSLREQVPFPQASLSKIFKPPRVFFTHKATLEEFKIDFCCTP